MSAFSELVVAAPLEVALSSSQDYEVVISAEGDEADLVRIAVEGETLSLELDGGLSSRPTVAVSMPATELTHLDVSEAAVVSTVDPLASPDLEVLTSGGSTTRLETDGVRRMAVTARDGSTVTVVGTASADTLAAAASSSSTLHLFGAPAAHVAAEATDASTIEVTATERLEATAAEVSTLTYRGSPGDVSEDASAVSTITSE